MATIMARPAAEAIRRRAEEDGIEFFFAQFVDMHAKPSAKLVPMSNFDGLVSEGAGFAGFAAGPIGQTPASPDMMGAIGPLFPGVNPTNTVSTRFNAGSFGSGPQGSISGITVMNRSAAYATISRYSAWV